MVGFAFARWGAALVKKCFARGGAVGKTLREIPRPGVSTPDLHIIGRCPRRGLQLAEAADPADDVSTRAAGSHAIRQRSRAPPLSWPPSAHLLAGSLRAARHTSIPRKFCATAKTVAGSDREYRSPIRAVNRRLVHASLPDTGHISVS